MNDTPYDSVPYRSHALTQTHPDRLAALARLFGMKARDIRGSRILELGCGDGSNLIPMACGLPESELTGIDLAKTALLKGQETINALGLRNIALLHMDINDVDREMGLFDYIIAHGLFSLVPPALQDKILRICKRNLAPQGVAYVSYNIYPGWHLRDMARDVMRFHADHFTDPYQKIEQARVILKFIVEAIPPSLETYKTVMKDELRHIIQSDIIYHDDLAETNHPLYFHEFMAMAQKHGLKYLAEAEFFEMQDHFFDPSVRSTLKRLSEHDILIKEQFMDFIKGRRFRQTLLRHEDAPINRKLHPRQMKDFYFSCPARPVDGEGRSIEGSPEELLDRADLMFRRPSGSTLGTDHPVPRAALLHLSRVWPARLPFQDLLEIGRKHRLRVSREQGAPDREKSEEDVLALGDILLSAFTANMVEIHVHTPHFARAPSDAPVASPYARLQSRASSRVTNLFHKTVELENTYGRALLPLLDGTRDRDSIRKEMTGIIRAGNLPLGGKLPSEKTTEDLFGEIDSELENCGRYALLVG
jgi:methyltransferase-like protein/2-polyprenyl-3-methyl-5-hydroxy-6-metoxy-1,4-benzoquinol methylase